MGVKPTFSSLGKETLRVALGINRHTSASLACENYLRANGSGGIVATPGLKCRYEELMLLDKKSCWPSVFFKLPTGTPIYCKSWLDLSLFPIWFAECEVYVPHDIALGPFPVRLKKKGTQRVHYPTSSGTYRTFIWSFQKEDAEKVGCIVKPIEGYGWKKTTDDTLPWVSHMYDLRQLWQHDPTISGNIKLITNSTPGGLGMSREMFYLVPDERKQDGDRVCLNDDKEPIEYHVHQEYNHHIPVMIHWMYADIARANSAVWNFAYSYAESGRLVWVNYDGILVMELNEGQYYPQKYSIDDMVAPIGSWSWRRLHNVFIPAPRAYESNEEVIRPGVRKLATVA